MEYLSSPYTEEERSSENFKASMKFLSDLEKKAQSHPVFNHPFLKEFADGMYGREGAVFVMTQIGKMVHPFTAAICALMGRSPDIRSRFVLFDNLYEEMGRGKLEQSHPFLYQDMLTSMGVSPEKLEQAETITSVRLLNDSIFDAILRKPFAVGCSWLGFGGELTIPNNFPYLMDGIKGAFSNGEVDFGFWDRHGDRDQEHSDDATTVLAMNMTVEDHPVIEREVYNSLTLRKLIWDECREKCAEFARQPAGAV